MAPLSRARGQLVPWAWFVQDHSYPGSSHSILFALFPVALELVAQWSVSWIRGRVLGTLVPTIGGDCRE